MLKLAVDGCVEVYRERVGQVEYGSVGERQQLRARLSCNSFQGGGGHISAEMRVEIICCFNLTSSLTLLLYPDLTSGTWTQFIHPSSSHSVRCMQEASPRGPGA